MFHALRFKSAKVLPCLVLLACAATQAPAATLTPDFSKATFAANQTIDNPYFPLGPSFATTLKAKGVDDEGAPFREKSVLSHGGPGRVINGVQTTTLRDFAYEDGRLVEDTFDYYAQDTKGNVWYMGEDVVNYIYNDKGKLVETNNKSSWIAGQNGAKPGWIMPAKPEIGLSYFQEVAPKDAALDEAKIWARGLTLTAGGRKYNNVMAILETTRLDPEARELKYYAPGVGLIRVEEGLDANYSNAEATFNVAPVPVPAALPLLISAVAGLSALGVRRRRAAG